MGLKETLMKLVVKVQDVVDLARRFERRRHWKRCVRS
jgi:hypothetical protein